MTKLTYKEARDKIIDAYFKDEIQPFLPEFCFCGTLSPNANWFDCAYSEVPRLALSLYPYSVEEYGKMEKALFSCFPKVEHLDAGVLKYPGTIDEYIRNLGKKYEDVLFAGMSAALDALKQIHLDRGEIIDQTPTFTKRELTLR